MGPIVAIPIQVVYYLRMAAMAARANHSRRADDWEHVAGTVIREANGTKWVRTIGGWLKRTGRR